MRRIKGYTDELEKINRDDSGIALNISLKEATSKKYDLELLVFLKQIIGTYCQIKVILCHIKIIIFQKQMNIKKLLISKINQVMSSKDLSFKSWA